MRPAEIAHQMMNFRLSTCFRYFQQWKRLPPRFLVKYKVAKTLFRKLGAENRPIIAKVLAAKLGAPAWEVLAQMRKPWSIKQIVSGEWREWPVTKTGVSRRNRAMAWFQFRLAARQSPEMRDIMQIVFNPNLGTDKNRLPISWNITSRTIRNPSKTFSGISLLSAHLRKKCTGSA